MGVGVGLARSPAILLLSWQPAASIAFSPFLKISIGPSVAEAYLGLEDPGRGGGRFQRPTHPDFGNSQGPPPPSRGMGMDVDVDVDGVLAPSIQRAPPRVCTAAASSGS